MDIKQHRRKLTLEFLYEWNRRDWIRRALIGEEHRSMTWQTWRQNPRKKPETFFFPNLYEMLKKKERRCYNNNSNNRIRRRWCYKLIIIIEYEVEFWVHTRLFLLRVS